MAAAPAELSDPDPSFPDLPPTPHHDGGDGLGLPFISRMLMEDDMDDSRNFFDEYPDHDALLQAQQTFAEILSDVRSSSSSSTTTTTTKPPGSGSTSVAVSPNTFTLPPPAFASATWPYDPGQLSQQLFSTTTAAENATMVSIMPPAAAAGDRDNHSVTMDMLNQAFLKGLEEANKFLPTTNSLFLDLQATSWNWKGMPMFQESTTSGRMRESRQHKNWDDDHDHEVVEAELGRSSKRVALEPEEAGEMAHEIVQDVYQSLVDEMQGLDVTSTGTEKKEKKSKGKAGNATEAMDLHTLLIQCAQAMARGGDHLTPTQLLRNIKLRSSPTGDATQRLAHCFAKGLQARLQGTAMPATAKRASAADLLRAYQLYMDVCSFEKMSFKFANNNIMALTTEKSRKGMNKFHVVDYGYSYGFQWPCMLSFWSLLEGGPPAVRITVIDLPQPGFRPAARINATGRCLSDIARHLGVPFTFRGITARWEMVRAEDLDIDPNEVLIVNGLLRLGNLMDEGADIDSPSPRDMVLGNIRDMRPDMFVLCIENSSYSAPFFAMRFREVLFYYSAMFDMMDAAAPRDSTERMLVEQELFGRRAMNAIACEGAERVERPEAYKQWQARCSRAGLRQVSLDSEIVSGVRKKVQHKYHRDFFVDVDEKWMLQGWKGRILYAMSTWVANDHATLTSSSS